MKLSIAAKGLILVAVPLLFELLFVAVLFFSLKESEAQVDRQLKGQAILEQSTILLKDMVAASFAMCFRNLAISKLSSEAIKVSIYDTLDKLDTLSGSDHDLQICCRELRSTSNTFLQMLQQLSSIPMQELLERLGSGGTNSELSQIRLQLRFMDIGARKLRNAVTNSEETTAAGFQGVDLREVLLIGVLLNLAVTIMMALNFARNISSRLSKLAENTRRVSRALAPLPLLGGADELSNLDLVIHKMAEQLQAAENQRKQLTSMVRGKLQEPLSEAKRVLENLQESKGAALPENAIVWLKKSSGHLERLLKLLNDLTSLNQIESGYIELNRRLVNSGELTQKAMESVQSLADKKELNLERSGPDLEFSGDLERLTQVLINLLSNAIKFAPSQSTISVIVRDLGKELELRVKDRGPGIPKELQSKIFERYEQTSREDATSRGGAGLGLNICAVIASSHGGVLSVDSELGHGSEFWLRLPKEASNSLAVAKSSEEKLPLLSSQKTASAISLKIWHKGLIVVAVPLVLQMGFLFLLNNSLEKSRLEVAQEIHAIKMSTTANEAYRDAINIATSSAGYYFSNEFRDYQSYGWAVEHVLSQICDMFNDERQDPDAIQLISDLLPRTQRVMLAGSKLMMDPPLTRDFASFSLLKKRAVALQKGVDSFSQGISNILDKEQSIKRKSPALRARTRVFIDQLIFAAVVLSILLSLLLGAFFSKNISKRLSLLIENTIRFTRAEELIPELAGADELNEFDTNFRIMVRKIQENQEFKRHIIAVVSHELRTPLTSIYGSLTLLLSGVYGPIPEASASELKKAHNDILQVMRLVNDLLDIERMEAGKFPMEIKAVSVQELLEKAIAIARESNQLAKFQLPPEGLSGIVNVDPELSAKALSKLFVFCAEKLAPPYDVLLELSEDSRYFSIKVPDLSDFLCPAADEQIYEKFQLLEHFEGRQNKGAALALSLCKTIVTQMGGEMSLASPSDNQAGSFNIRLPKVQKETNK